MDLERAEARLEAAEAWVHPEQPTRISPSSPALLGVKEKGRGGGESICFWSLNVRSVSVVLINLELVFIKFWLYREQSVSEIFFIHVSSVKSKKSELDLLKKISSVLGLWNCLFIIFLNFFFVVVDTMTSYSYWNVLQNWCSQCSVRSWVKVRWGRAVLVQRPRVCEMLHLIWDWLIDFSVSMSPYWSRVSVVLVLCVVLQTLLQNCTFSFNDAGFVFQTKDLSLNPEQYSVWACICIWLSCRTFCTFLSLVEENPEAKIARETVIVYSSLHYLLANEDKSNREIWLCRRPSVGQCWISSTRLYCMFNTLIVGFSHFRHCTVLKVDPKKVKWCWNEKITIIWWGFFCPLGAEEFYLQRIVLMCYRGSSDWYRRQTFRCAIFIHVVIFVCNLTGSKFII